MQQGSLSTLEQVMMCNLHWVKAMENSFLRVRQPRTNSKIPCGEYAGIRMVLKSTFAFSQAVTSKWPLSFLQNVGMHSLLAYFGLLSYVGTLFNTADFTHVANSQGVETFPDRASPNMKHHAALLPP